MEDDPLQAIIEIQGQIMAMRRGAAAFPDPKLQAAYFPMTGGRSIVDTIRIRPFV
jgi:hypothetical protein